MKNRKYLTKEEVEAAVETISCNTARIKELRAEASKLMRETNYLKAQVAYRTKIRGYNYLKSFAFKKFGKPYNRLTPEEKREYNRLRKRQSRKLKKLAKNALQSNDIIVK